MTIQIKTFSGYYTRCPAEARFILQASHDGKTCTYDMGPLNLPGFPITLNEFKDYYEQFKLWFLALFDLTEDDDVSFSARYDVFGADIWL